MNAIGLPTPVLAHILECLGEAGEIVRAAAAARALWAAASGPFIKVHVLVLRCPMPDIDASALLSLQQRFPNIQQLHVGHGSWHWTGCRSIAAWSAKMKELHADHTSYPLAAVLTQRKPQPQQAHVPAAALAAPAADAAATAVGSASQQQDSVVAAFGTQQQQQQQLHKQHSRTSRQQQRQPQQRQQLDVSTSVPANLQNLVQLQLRHIVTDVIKCRQHGSSTCDCLDTTVLSALLQQNPQLRTLDLEGNSGLPDRLMYAAAQAASCSSLKTLDLSGCQLLSPGAYVPDWCPGLTYLDISDTATTDAGVVPIAARLTALRRLALAGCRRVSNYGLDALAEAPAVTNGHLTHLDLGGLTRPTSTAHACLAQAWAKGCVSSSSSSSRSSSSSTGHGSTQVLLHVGLARTAGVTDAVLQAFLDAAGAASVPAGTACSSSSGRPQLACSRESNLELDAFQSQQQQQQQQQQLESLLRELGDLVLAPSQEQQQQQQQQQQQRGPKTALQPCIGLCGLHLAGCNGVSSGMLLQLGAAGVLAALASLDLCDTEAFRQPMTAAQQQQQQLEARHTGGLIITVDDVTSMHSDMCSSVSRSALPQLLRYTGQQLHTLLLDGCYIDDAAAAAVAAQGLPCLQMLSLVGCRGLNNTGMRCLLGSLPNLQVLSIGGSVSAWSEGASLQGLPVLGGLTQLKLMRRPVLRDAELVSVLVEASNLRSLSLVGCYMLTDKAFELATTAASGTVPQGSSKGSSSPDSSGMDVASPQGHRVQPQGITAQQGCGAAALVPLQQHLTQLCLAACDSITGSSIARLQGLRHLRASFCASLSTPALQHVVVSCRNLQLLELPASMSSKGLGFTPVRFDGPSYIHNSQNLNQGLQASGGAYRPGRGGSGSRRGSGHSSCQNGVSGSKATGIATGHQGSRGGAFRGVASAAGHEREGLVLPQQGSDQAWSFMRLKVNWL